MRASTEALEHDIRAEQPLHPHFLLACHHEFHKFIQKLYFYGKNNIAPLGLW